jgi:hypothetical protein
MNNPEFEKFDAIVRKVFSVPHEEIVKREKAYQRKRQRAKQKRAKTASKLCADSREADG